MFTINIINTISKYNNNNLKHIINIEKLITLVQYFHKFIKID